MARNKKLTRGQMEAEISNAVTHFEKEHIGRGPLETKTYIVDDMLIVRLKGMLTRAETRLAKVDKTSRGRDIIKRMRMELIENARPLLDVVIRSITKRKVRSLHTDISTVTGERLLIFVMDKPIQFS